MTDQVLQQLWEAYSAHEGRKHKRATRKLVTTNDLDRFRADFNHIINTIKAETWWEACVRIADGENHLDIAHVYQKRNPYLGEEPMTTPIERAAEALVNAAFGQELPEAPIDLAKAVFDSIDTDGLADALVRDLTYSTGLDSESNDSIARHQAPAVIEWLTTGEKLGGPERPLGPTRIERKHQ